MTTGTSCPITWWRISICREFDIRACSLMIFDDRLNQLFRISSFGLSDESLTKGPVFVDDKCNSFKKGEPVLIQDLQKDPKIQYPEAAARENGSA